LKFYSDISLKQQTSDRHVALPGHILITSPLVWNFFLVMRAYRRSNTIQFDSFCSTQPGLESTTYLTEGEHASDVVIFIIDIYNS